MPLKFLGFSFFLLFQKFLLFFIMKAIFLQDFNFFFFELFLEPPHLFIVLFNFPFSLFSCEFSACMLFSSFFDKFVFLAGGKIFPVVSCHSAYLLDVKLWIFLVNFFISHFVVSDISTDGFLLLGELIVLFLEFFALTIPYLKGFLIVLFFLGR